MSSLFRFIWSLFLPRLPRFGPEDVASIAEYSNRLARLEEAAMNPPDMWIGRISTQLVLRIQRYKIAEKVPQQILGRAA
jgi:hypothetical protein